MSKHTFICIYTLYQKLVHIIYAEIRTYKNNAQTKFLTKIFHNYNIFFVKTITITHTHTYIFIDG